MFWYNGKLISGNSIELAIDDPGLIYGATVFTTFRIYQSLDSSLTDWQGHCDRLRTTLEDFGWQQPDWQRLRQGAEVMAEHFPVLRAVIFANGREWITGRQLPADLPERQQQGITAWLANQPMFRRPLAAYKTANYLPAWLALQQAQKFGAKEAILVDETGNWLETSTGNLWGWGQGKWQTPPVDGRILPGLGRSHLVNWLRNQGETVEERLWDQNLVANLEAIAYTNSVMQVIPIHTIVNQEILTPYPHSIAKFQQLPKFFG